MVNIYKANETNPYHLSTAAILLADNGEVVFHYFRKKLWRQIGKKWDNYAALLSETVEDGETPSETIVRGVKEEFGVSARVIGFLGSGVSEVPSSWGQYRKTVLYFVLPLEKNQLPRSTEPGAVAVFLDVATLCDLMSDQRKRGVGIGADGFEGLLRFASTSTGKN
jgi:ADP-ribose pyrophosphatase YjhB (NUDIX family)